MNTGKSVLRQISDRDATIQEEKRGKRTDLSREDLEQDVAEFLARGGEILEVESYAEGPVRPRAHASDKNGGAI